MYSGKIAVPPGGGGIVVCGIESVLQNVMKTFLTFLINKCQYKTSYLIFAAEIKINI
jgi:hypothetical protein